MMDLRKKIFSAVKCLITPPTDTRSLKPELNTYLSRKVSELEELLDTSDFTLLNQSLKDVNIIFPNAKHDVRKTFLEFCLRLLCCLKNSIETACSNLKTVPTANQSPSLSPDVLSVQEQSIISECLQFIVGLGIITNLLPGVGTPIEKRTNFIDYIKNDDAHYSDSEKHCHLLACVKTLLLLIKQSSLGSIILSRHCGDILAALLQLSFAPLPLEHDEDETIKEAEQKHSKNKLDFLRKERQLIKVSLSKFLDRVYQPIVIRELLILQGFSQEPSQKDSSYSSPVWLRKACSRLLTERLVRPHGVYSVIDAILGIGGGKNEKIALHHKYQIIAKLISTCPKQFKQVDEYFNLICSQIVELLKNKNETIKQQYLQVICLIVMNIVIQHPDVANKKIMFPLFEPLHNACITDSQEGDDPFKERESKDDEKIIVPENTLSSCIETLYKLFVIGVPPNSELLSCLNPIIGPLFHIFCFVRSSVSYLKSPVNDILISFFCHTETEKIVSILKSLMSLEITNNHTLTWNPCFEIKNGNNGGINVTIKETSEEEEMEMIDKDHESIECLMEIFKKCSKEAFVSKFFLSVLQDLTSVMSTNFNLQKEIKSESKVLLHSEEMLMKHLKYIRRSLLIFSILENMIGETYIQEIILRDVPLVFKFIMTLLERAVNLSATEIEMEIIEMQTLTMAMTILALMITEKTISSHKNLLKQCLPTLRILIDTYSDERIRSLAEDLAIAISTHGTVMPASRKQHSTTDIQSTLEDRITSKMNTNSSTNTATTNPNENFGSKSKNNHKRQNEGEKKNIKDKLEKTPFQQAWYDLSDPILPVQGHALLQLQKLLLAKDKETLDNKIKLLKIFKENLEHEDSYIYLMAASGLSALADVFADEIIPLLAKEFANFDIQDPKCKRSPELRMKLGESLVSCTKVLGDLTPKYKSSLLNAFLSGCKDPDSHVRSSSLSNLAEVCKGLGFSLGSHVQEIFQCLSSIVKSDPSVEVRRACINVITLLLRGIGKDAFQVLDTIMLNLYKLLKTVNQQENDDIVKLHVQLALEELSNITKDFLFPQQTLQKKIQILDYH